MNIKDIKNNLKIIIYSYRKIVKNLLYFLIYMSLVIFSSLIITLPLWYAATKYSKFYTFTVLTSISAILIIVLINNLKKWIISKQKEGKSVKSIIMIPIKKTATFILFLSGLYAITLTYTSRLIYLAIILSIIYLLILGYFIFISRKHLETA